MDYLAGNVQLVIAIFVNNIITNNIENYIIWNYKRSN